MTDKKELEETQEEIVKEVADLKVASEPENEADNDDNASDNASNVSYDSQDPESEYYDPENEFRKQPIEEVRSTVKEMEQCYIDAQKEMKEMAEMVAKYKSLKAKCNKLSAYWFYQGPWSVYMERMEEECPDEKFEIHGESALFDLSHEFDDLTLELLRESALEVSKDV